MHNLWMLRKPKEVDPTVHQEQVERGRQAEELLRSDYFREALDEIESVYLEAWRTSDPYDIERRERSYVATMLLNDIKHLLLSHVRTGAVARDILEKTLRQ